MIIENYSKSQLYDIFISCNSKTELYKYFNLSDCKKNKELLDNIAQYINFDFNIYIERRKQKKYCLNCGKELIKGQKKYCSRTCAVIVNNKNRVHKQETKDKISFSLKKRYKLKGKEKQKKYCLNCGKELIKGQKKYCSLKCTAQKRKEGYKKHFEKQKCLYCGESFIGLNDRKYCSIQCDSAHKKENIIKLFLSGEYYINGNNNIPSTIRKYLFDKANYKCELCGYEGYNLKTGNTILQIHHKDGNSGNNKPDNLIVLCPNCHAKTENYMALNKGVSKRDKRFKK